MGLTARFGTVEDDRGYSAPKLPHQPEHLVKKGLLDAEYADTLRRAFDLRQRSDYELYAELGEELARQTLKDAERFVEKARELLSAGASAQPGRGLQYSGARNPEPLRDRRSTTQNLPYS